MWRYNSQKFQQVKTYYSYSFIFLFIHFLGSLIYLLTRKYIELCDTKKECAEFHEKLCQNKCSVTIDVTALGKDSTGFQKVSNHLCVFSDCRDTRAPTAYGEENCQSDDEKLP